MSMKTNESESFYKRKLEAFKLRVTTASLEDAAALRNRAVANLGQINRLRPNQPLRKRARYVSKVDVVAKGLDLSIS